MHVLNIINKKHTEYFKNINLLFIVCRLYQNSLELLFIFQKGRYFCPSWLSTESKILLSQMLQVDPLKRISIEELKVHPWVLTDFNTPVDWTNPKEVKFILLYMITIFNKFHQKN